MITILTLLLLTAILIETTYILVQIAKHIRPVKDNRSIFVDTSVLMDGRILMVAESGFIPGSLLIPRSVVGELQFLADNADHDKRARARYGLDVIKRLQEMKNLSVTVLQDGSRAEEGVDERLLNLAKKHGGAILTIDYNLNKVATVEDIQILNINELAQKLRMSHLPGERLLIDLVQQGQDTHQGVGYLPDGTMVVVEHASKLIGQQVEIEFIRAIQTAAGKMMFARLVEKQSSPGGPRQNRHTKKIKPESNRRSVTQQSPTQSAEDNFINMMDKQ